jgi:hypothetical protein
MVVMLPVVAVARYPSVRVAVGLLRCGPAVAVPMAGLRFAVVTVASHASVRVAVPAMPLPVLMRRHLPLELLRLRRTRWV